MERFLDSFVPEYFFSYLTIEIISQKVIYIYIHIQKYVLNAHITKYGRKYSFKY